MFPNDDDLIASLFEGHDDLIEDCRGDFAARLGETEQTQGEFLHPDTNPSLLPLMTNFRDRWKRIRGSVLTQVATLSSSVVGDEVCNVLKKFDFRVMEAFENPKSCPKCGSTSTEMDWSSQNRRGYMDGVQQSRDRKPVIRNCRSCGNVFDAQPKPRADQVEWNSGMITNSRNKLQGAYPKSSTLTSEGRIRFESGLGYRGSRWQREPEGALDDFGWSVTSEDPENKLYTHPNHPGREIHVVHSSGSWRHYDGDKLAMAGFTGPLLRQHLEGFHKRSSKAETRRSEDCGKTGKHKDGRKYDDKKDVVEALIDQFTETGLAMVTELHVDPMIRDLDVSTRPISTGMRARGNAGKFPPHEGEPAPHVARMQGTLPSMGSRGGVECEKCGGTNTSQEKNVPHIWHCSDCTHMFIPNNAVDNLGEHLDEDLPNKTYYVHMDRNVVAPGSRYMDWHTKGHIHKVHTHLDNAGLGHLKGNLTSVGYDDVSLELSSDDVAVAAARSLDAHLPPASDAYKSDYANNLPNFHHTSVSVMSGKDNMEYHGLIYPHNTTNESQIAETVPASWLMASPSYDWSWQDRKSSVDHRELGKQGIYQVSPRYSLKHGNYIDFYDREGNKQYGQVTHLDNASMKVKVGNKTHDLTLQSESVIDQADALLGEYSLDHLDRNPSVRESVVEKAPPGFEGTVRAMKGEPGIDNPWALAWHMKNKGYKSHKKADGSDKDEDLIREADAILGESVAPGYIIPLGPSNNASRPDGRHDAFGVQVPHASEALQDLHRRLGSALPELHALTVSTITDERTALSMLFHELHTAHCDIGNVMSYSNQISDLEMSEVVSHYTKVVSEMLAALNPWLQKNPAVSTGPYKIGGTLHDSRMIEASHADVAKRFGYIKDLKAVPSSSLPSSQQHFIHPNTGHKLIVGHSGYDRRHVQWDHMNHDGSLTGGGSTSAKLATHLAGIHNLPETYDAQRRGSGDFDWSYGKGKPMAAGQHVKVNVPGHAYHGQSGQIIRQQSNQFAVEFPHRPGKVEFFGAHQLERTLNLQGGLQEMAWNTDQSREYLASQGFEKQPHDMERDSYFNERHVKGDHMIVMRIGGMSGTPQTFDLWHSGKRVTGGYLSQLPRAAKHWS